MSLCTSQECLELDFLHEFATYWLDVNSTGELSSVEFNYIFQTCDESTTMSNSLRLHATAVAQFETLDFV